MITACEVCFGISGRYYAIYENTKEGDAHRVGHVIVRGYSYTCLDEGMMEMPLEVEWIQAVLERQRLDGTA